MQMWVFILMVSGEPVQAFPSASENRCKDSMAKILMAQQQQGKQATGACYVRATAIDDTERRRIVEPEGR